MRAAAAIHESFRPRLVVAIDPAVGRWAGDSILAAQVRYRHLFLLITRQKLQDVDPRSDSLSRAYNIVVRAQIPSIRSRRASL